MAKKVIMPKLGLTMEEGVINKWLVKEGDQVEKGDPLFEVATDKVNMEVEAPSSGTVLKILYPDGATVPITQIVAYLGEAGEEVPEEETKEEVVEKEGKEEGEKITAQVSAPSAQEAPPEEVATEERVKASPLARRLAKEYQLELSQIKGSGPGGRIVKEDVEQAYRERQKLSVEEVPAPGRARLPQSRMRKVIAQRMLESVQTKPHFFLTQEIWAGELVKTREKLLPLVEKKTGFRVSYTDIIVKLVARALEEFPLMNAYLVEGELEINPEVNIGVAVALEDGLIVPVVKEASKKSLAQISEEISQLAEKARAGKLSPEEISGGTFTISNLGMYGVDVFQAIINPPELAILACGAIKKKPYYNGREIVPDWMINLTLSADHRVVDGASAAQFMSFLKTLIENPISVII